MSQPVTLEDLYLYFSICFVLIFVGVSIIYAAWNRVKYFVDPSEHSLLELTPALIKRVVGGRGLLVYWYVLGGCFLAAGSAGFFMGLLRLLQGLGPAN